MMNLRKIKKEILNTLTIAKYMILMFFREKTAIFFSLFIPVMLMSIFGVINTGGGVKFNVAVVDEAKNHASQQVVTALQKVSVFTITTKSKNDALADLKNSKQTYAIVIPEGFGSNFAEYGAKQAELAKLPVSQQQAVSTVTPQRIDIYYDQSQNSSTISVGFTVFDKIFDGVTHQIARVPNFFEVRQLSISGNDLKYIDFLIPGLVAMSVMQLSIFAVTGQIVSWRERGILKRLLATPIHPGVIIFSQIVSRVIITFMQASILILLGILAFNLHIVGSLGLVVLLIVAGGLIFLSMGFALSGIASTQNTVAALANLFVFPQMFLSGIFFPRDAFPDWLLKASDYFPLTYFSDALRNVMVKGYTITQISGDLIGLAIWAIIMFVLAIKLFRWE